ncbi:MAG: DoxX family protein [Fluviicola sp.]
MKNKILFVVSLLFGLMFINSGLNKFFQYMPMPKEMPAELLKVMEAFTTIVWLMPLIAVIEIIAGVLVIIPKYRALGALMMLPIMVGILLQHIVYAPSTLAIPLVLFVILIWMLVDNREKYRSILQ